MLTEYQVNQVWENLLAAQTRSLYFADWASRFAGRKQWITGASFFLSSAAAASLIGKSPAWVPIAASTTVAVATAYSIAVGLDRKIRTMSKLHSEWSQIAADYERLWNHVYDEDAEVRLNELIEREKEPSEMATSEAPYDQRLLGKWQDHVFSMYHLSGEHG